MDIIVFCSIQKLLYKAYLIERYIINIRLSQLVNIQLNHLDLDYSTLERILVEPTWISENGREISLCDAILVFSTFAVPLELKQSLIKREKALKQLRNGKKYIGEELQIESANYGLFVIYNPLIHIQSKPFKVEKVYF